MGIFLIGLMVFILIGIAVRKSNEQEEKEQERELIRKEYTELENQFYQDKLNKLNLLEKEIEENQLIVTNWVSIKNDIIKNSKSQLEFNKGYAEINFQIKKEIVKHKKIVYFNAKYQNLLDQNQINKLIREEFFIEMTEEMLSESRGKPTSFSQTIVRGKLQKKFVYDKDWIVFENGVVIKTKQDKNKAI